MAVISITATGFGGELLAGIPQFLSLETNVPATIFYTLDGSVPTAASPVYVGAFEMPQELSVRLRALAISGLDTGTLDVVFGSEPLPVFASKQPRPVVDAYVDVTAFYDGYSLDGLNAATIPAKGSDEDLSDSLFRFSPTDHLGNPPGVLISIGFPDPRVFAEERQKGISLQASSPNNQNVFFNPRSLYVVIDGRDGYADQVHDGYRIINRPHAGTMDITRYLGGKLLYEPHPYISGGLVRFFEDRKKGIRVSYYFDHNETRWIKSIQRISDSLPPGVGRRPASIPFVVKWIQNRRSMI